MVQSEGKAGKGIKRIFRKPRIAKDYDVSREVTLLIRSRYGIICLETDEDERAEALLAHLADSMNLPLLIWNLAKGLERIDVGTPVFGTADARQALGHIEKSALPAICLFQGIDPILQEDSLVMAKVVQVGRMFSTMEGALILTGRNLPLPDAAKPYSAHVRLPPPALRDYADLLDHVVRDVGGRRQVKVRMTSQEMDRLLTDLNGLTLLEAEKILTKAIIEDGCLSAEDLKLVIAAKRAIVEREGLLEYYPVEESMTRVADLERLKAWLSKRKSILRDRKRASQYGLTFPKGILLLGVPGSGKSLCAKAVAMEWGLPLLKMDPSGLYNKYIGESERNFKRAMVTAENMAPVILWIDEIEKAFAGGGSEDGGVSLRVLGTFLSWLQERKGDVFVVATSNDVTRLPPEFLRKGRFDEIFFLDLPEQEAREAVFRIHLERRGQDPKRFDILRLGTASQGFTGAEIEQVVVSALCTAFTDQGTLTTDLLLKEIGCTYPLSRTRFEEIQTLRAWAKDRTVGAQ